MLTLLAPTLLMVAPAEAVPTVAIADLVNHTGDPSMMGAGPGVAGLLVSRFQQTDSIKVVERDALQSVLSELSLSMSGLVDTQSAVRTGRLLGARYLVVGELFSVKLPSISIALRVVDTETGEVVLSRDVVGEVGDNGEEFFKLVDLLADDILDGMNITLPEADRDRLSSIDRRELKAVIAYGKKLMTVSLDHPRAMYRDKSYDHYSDSRSRRFKVLTNDGENIYMPAFSRRVGDEDKQGDYDLAIRGAVRKKQRKARVGWSLIGAGAVGLIGGFAAFDTGAAPPLTAIGGGLMVGGIAAMGASEAGYQMEVGRLSSPGYFYEPTEADRWIADYNLGLR